MPSVQGMKEWLLLKRGKNIMQEWLTAISTVGFPIAMCVLLFWYMTKQNEQHAEETKALTSVVNELKIAITELREELRSDRNEYRNH